MKEYGPYRVGKILGGVIYKGFRLNTGLPNRPVWKTVGFWEAAGFFSAMPLQVHFDFYLYIYIKYTLIILFIYIYQYKRFLPKKILLEDIILYLFLAA